jgi:hypothetical protein
MVKSKPITEEQMRTFRAKAANELRVGIDKTKKSIDITKAKLEGKKNRMIYINHAIKENHLDSSQGALTVDVCVNHIVDLVGEERGLIGKLIVQEQKLSELNEKEAVMNENFDKKIASGTGSSIKIKQVQTTLFTTRNKFKFTCTKVIEGKRMVVNTNTPKYQVADKFVGLHVCNECPVRQTFVSKAGLVSHISNRHIRARVRVNIEDEVIMSAVLLQETVKESVKEVKVEKLEKTKQSRKAYPVHFKMKVAEHYLEMKAKFGGKTRVKVMQTVADLFNVAKSVVGKWSQADELAKFRDRLTKGKPGRGNRKKTNMFRAVTATRLCFPGEEKRLHLWFLEEQANGRRVSSFNLRIKMRQFVAENHTKNATKIYTKRQVKFTSSQSWSCYFRARYGIVPRRKTNVKADIVSRIKAVQRFHIVLQNRIKRNRRGDSPYGRWAPERRFNVDQVPMPLETGGSIRTMNKRGEKVVWVMSKGEAALKVCDSLYICITVYI